MIFIFMLLVFLDFYLTWDILSRGGSELNPFVRWFMQKFGVKTGLIISRFVVLFFALTVMAYSPKLITILVGGYFIVVCWNLYQRFVK